jgi:hypothetical protein
MRGFAGSCRFIFNRALALQQEIYDLCGFRPGYGELCEEMARWKKEPETSWLKDAPSQALQQSLKNLEDAWHRHLESRKKLKAGKFNPNQLIGPPRFKKKGQHDSFRFPQGFELDQENSRVFLPKLGWIRYRSWRDQSPAAVEDRRQARLSTPGPPDLRPVQPVFVLLEAVKRLDEFASGQCGEANYAHVDAHGRGRTMNWLLNLTLGKDTDEPLASYWVLRPQIARLSARTSRMLSSRGRLVRTAAIIGPRHLGGSE